MQAKPIRGSRWLFRSTSAELKEVIQRCDVLVWPKNAKQSFARRRRLRMTSKSECNNEDGP
jgi:hypothetical protein